MPLTASNYIAIFWRDRRVEVVNGNRPATLLAFAREHGKDQPESYDEVAWLVHNALGVEQPLDEWVEGLEHLSAFPDDVALARRCIAGDEDAIAEAYGEREPELAPVDDVREGVQQDPTPPPVESPLELSSSATAAAMAAQPENRLAS
jgi:hypothetical protein